MDLGFRIDRKTFMYLLGRVILGLDFFTSRVKSEAERQQPCLTPAAYKQSAK